MITNVADNTKAVEVSPPRSHDTAKLLEALMSRPETICHELAAALRTDVLNICDSLRKISMILEERKRTFLGKLKVEVANRPEATIYELATALNARPSNIWNGLRLLGFEFKEHIPYTLETLALQPDALRRELAMMLGTSLTLLGDWKRKPEFRLGWLDYERLKEEVEKHPYASTRELAKMMNVGKTTVKTAMKSLGIRPKNQKYLDHERLKEEMKKHPHATQRELAKILNFRNNKTIARALRKMGVKPKVQRYFDITKLKEEIEKHPDASQRELAERLGVHNSVVCRGLQKLGFKLRNRSNLAKRQEEVETGT